MPPKKATSPTEGTRRSSRVVPAPAAKVAKAPAKAVSKKAAAPKKRAKAEIESEDDEEDDESEDEKPKRKKAKVTKKAPAGKKEPAAKKAPAAKKEKAEVSDGLNIGDTLPETTLKNEKDEDVNVKELAEKGLVLFVVPKANTPGCTAQACAFRDSYADFAKEGYAVYGLSNDKSAAQIKWQEKESLSYPLLSDPSRGLISALGAGTTSKTIRSHFIFEKGTGKLLDKQVPVTPAKSSVLALKFIQDLKTSGDKPSEDEPSKDEPSKDVAAEEPSEDKPEED